MDNNGRLQDYGYQNYPFDDNGSSAYPWGGQTPLEYASLSSPLATGLAALDSTSASGSQNSSFDGIQEVIKSRNDEPWNPPVLQNQQYLQVPGPINGRRKAATIAGPVYASRHRRPDVQSQYSRRSRGNSNCFSIPEESGDLNESTVRANQGLGPNLIAHRSPTASVRSAPTTGRASRSRSSFAPNCPLPGCGKPLKNKSDALKHEYQHIKPYTCGVPECPRKREGFATHNDLQRHRKSVHSFTPTVGRDSIYICEGCSSSNTAAAQKRWPRLDNFKAHIARKHKDWSQAHLIAASEVQPIPSDSGYGSQMPNDYGQQGPMGPHGSPAIRMSRNSSYEGNNVDSGFDQNPADPLAGVGSGAMMRASSQSSGFATVGIFGNSTSQSIGTLLHGQADALHIPPNQQFPIGQQSFNLDEAFGHVNHEHRSPLGVHSSSDQHTIGPMFDEQNSNGKTTELQCPECHKTKKRDCDLRKHMKRHTRPYGCTFEGCGKRLGSRNDWKRHESSQHYLREMWFCEACTLGVDSKNAYIDHLEQKHNCQREMVEVPGAIENMYLGRDAHYRYWCGFCRRLIEQEEPSLQQGQPPGVNALEIRFHHIGEHYDKGKREMDTWVHMRTMKTPTTLPERTSKGNISLRSRNKRDIQDDSSDLGEDGIPTYAQQQTFIQDQNDPGYWTGHEMTTYGPHPMNMKNDNDMAFYDDARDADGELDDGF